MMDPQMIQAMMQAGLGQDNPEAQKLKRQQAMASMMREQAVTPQQGHMAGRVYAGPNAMGAIANLGSGLMANRMGQQADATGAGIANQTIDAKKRYLEALTAALRRPAAPPQAPQAPMAPPQAPQQQVPPPEY